MGTVIPSLVDDDDVEHTFTLHRVVHMSQSPVNILSTRRLAEVFPDINSRPDRKSSGVVSIFDEMS